MGFLSMIPIIGDLFKGAKDLVSEAITDKDKKLELEHKLKMLQLETENKILEMGHQEQLAQIDVNKEEAKADSLFISGWRPACGWCCVLALFYNFILYNFLLWFIKVQEINITPPPQIPSDLLYPLLFGMLGLVSARSLEKFKGVANK